MEQYNQYDLRFLDPNSPFTLFLIFILLILGTESELESYFDNAKNFVLETKRSMKAIRGGFENLHTNMHTFHAQLLDIQKK